MQSFNLNATLSNRGRAMTRLCYMSVQQQEELLDAARDVTAKARPFGHGILVPTAILSKLSAVVKARDAERAILRGEGEANEK